MGLTHAPKIVTDGLVLCLDAANTRSYPKSGTTWSDLAGSNHGTMQNMTVANYSDEKRGALSFDGTDEYVVGGDTSSVNNHYTICAWFKATGAPSTNDSGGGHIFNQSSAGEHGIAMNHSWANQRSVISSKLNNFLGSSNNSVSNNEIHFQVGLWNGTQQELWVDGILIASRSYTLAPTLGTPKTYQIARWGYPGYGRYLQGNVYNVMLYNKGLTADEVLQNYNATKGRFN